MSIKSFITKKLIQSQMKNVPQEQQEMILAMVEKHPELFQKIATEMDARIKKGEHQMFAMMEVMKKYQGELQDALGAPAQQIKQRPF
jgi:uncharacterized protein YneF (UPF0154 family)